MRRWLTALALGLLGGLTLSSVGSAQTGSLTFDPPTVSAGGGKLFINGSCEANTSGFVISEAFAGQPSVSDFAGVPALPITTSDTGTFGIGLTIVPTVQAGTYPVSLRCGGGLAASGTLTVTHIGLAKTGAPVGMIAAMGAGAVAVGLAFVLLGRRRSHA
jgi:LPXTG-motif cell wall-anchored protein